MIWEFIPEVLVLLGFGGVLLIVTRKSRSLSDEDVERVVQENKVVRLLRAWHQAWVKPNLDSQKIEERFWLWLEKALRSLRIVNFKVENWVTGKLEWVKAVRKKKEFDEEYWFSVHKMLVEKKIEELFGSVPVKTIEDPVREELSLKRRRKESLDAWLNLVRWYLEANNVPEARRVLIACWQKNPADERVLALLEILIVKTEEMARMPQPVVAQPVATLEERKPTDTEQETEQTTEEKETSRDASSSSAVGDENLVQ